MTELFIVGQIDALEFESKFWSEFHGLRVISGKDLAARDPGDVREVDSWPEHGPFSTPAGGYDN
ncbi:hypothetical protein ACFZCT_31930 [Streptomyces qaidamensis]|uniref:hypothetical protein n=1 Tax=Streptomyces qaidamensis TaxID=1783515 RepID=UPI0036E1AECE